MTHPKLALETLDELPDAISVPGYSREKLSRGILHFGIGNFHRAHQARYLDRLFEAGHDLDWALVGAGVLPADEASRDTLLAQDGLYTLVEQSADSDAARVVGTLIDYLPIANFAAIIDAMCDPEIRIVSMTVTEGGYFVDAETGRVSQDAEALVTDGERPDAPETVFGLIAAALRRRRDEGTPPFTVMSCDNLPHNGKIAREAVQLVAGRWDESLRDWIESEVSFPCGMVDRITPATGDRERRRIVEEFGVDDRMPVFGESFTQWVLEDRFSAGRPALEKVDVRFVDDVEPYETMKMRILNGGHAIIAYPAALLDIEFAHDAMADRHVAAFMERVERREVLPRVPPVDGIDFDAYLETVIERFGNPKIGDTTRRLCFDGSNRQPKFIVLTAADALREGGDYQGLAITSALWCRYCLGETESGQTVEPNDPHWSRLQRIAREAEQTPEAWLDMRDVYGETGRDPGFRQAFVEAHESLRESGVRATLDRYLSDT